MTKAKAAFDKFDADGGGTIEIEELTNVLKNMGQDPSPEELKAIIDVIDQDGNGELDFEEFLKLL